MQRFAWVGILAALVVGAACSDGDETSTEEAVDVVGDASAEDAIGLEDGAGEDPEDAEVPEDTVEEDADAAAPEDVSDGDDVGDVEEIEDVGPDIGEDVDDTADDVAEDDVTEDDVAEDDVAEEDAAEEDAAEDDAGPVCSPLVCEGLGATCGAYPDGCGGTLDCGGCDGGGTCQGGTCVCTPFCGGNECGDDGCGGLCGTCAEGELCAGGQCSEPLCGDGCGVDDFEVDCGPDCSCFCDAACFGLGDCCAGICNECSAAFPDQCICEGCEDQECGTDSCGASCGTCEAGEACQGGLCVPCEPNCGDATCGPDGCGGSCGACAEDEGCVEGACVAAPCAGLCGDGPGECWCDAVCFMLGDCCEDVCESCGVWFPTNCCEPDCSDTACGDDGCGGSCGACDAGEVCVLGDCYPCTPACEDKTCGADGCGGSCGECTEDEACTEGVCVACAPDCAPPLPEIAVAGIPDDLAPLATFFTKHASVFGVHVVGTASVPDDKLSHATHVLAQYLDNDEDGVPDNPDVVAQLAAPPIAVLVMFGTSSELDGSGIFESPIPGLYAMQDLHATETHPEGSTEEGGFDATLEEVLHLITHHGHSVVYPEELAEEPGSALADAMDIARGGQFFGVPAVYPEEAWYHYDDTTCDYGCMATEYLYWALTSLLGAQAAPWRCEDIAVEWELCTPELVESVDTAIYELLTNPLFVFPTVLPDGSYGD